MKISAFTGFLGAAPAADPRLLPDNVGTVAKNVRLTRGDVRPLNAPLNVATVPGGRKTIYRMGRDAPSDSSYWLSWNTEVDCIRSFNPEDTTERTIFTGSGSPKWTNNVFGLATAPYPTAARELGVPAPTTAVTVAINTNPATGTEEDVFVVCTFVNDLGEEGAPGPVSAKVKIKPGALLDISNLPAIPSGNYGLTMRRLYCSKVSDTTTDLYLGAEVAAAATSAQINHSALNDVLQTNDYTMPPADGHSIVELWNGIAAMISGRAVRFCEERLIYAWPTDYSMPLGDKPVGLGVFDQVLLVLTTGRPAIITGQTPSGMSLAPISLDQSCVAKRSIVTFGHTVCWASPDGLMAMSSSGPKNLTAGAMTREDWQALNPSTIKGVAYDNRYYGFYDNGTPGAFVVDPTKPGALVFLDYDADAAHRDPVNNQMYFVSGANVKKFDAGTAGTFTVKSKVHRVPAPVTFICAQVIADSYTNVVFKLYANGVLKHTRTVTNQRGFALPQGFVANDWQIEVSGQSPVLAAHIATDWTELDRK